MLDTRCWMIALSRIQHPVSRIQQTMTTRRDFLKQMQAASLAAMAASIPAASFLSGCRPGQRRSATDSTT